MKSDVVQSEFATQPQRLAVCFSQWKRAHKSGKANWEDTEATIKRDGLILTEDEARFILANRPKEEYEQGKQPPFSPGKVGQPNAPILNEDGKALRVGYDDNPFVRLLS